MKTAIYNIFDLSCVLALTVVLFLPTEMVRAEQYNTTIGATVATTIQSPGAEMLNRHQRQATYRQQSVYSAMTMPSDAMFDSYRQASDAATSNRQRTGAMQRNSMGGSSSYHSSGGVVSQGKQVSGYNNFSGSNILSYVALPLQKSTIADDAVMYGVIPNPEGGDDGYGDSNGRVPLGDALLPLLVLLAAYTILRRSKRQNALR